MYMRAYCTFEALIGILACSEAHEAVLQARMAGVEA